MSAYISEMNILVDFILNKNDTRSNNTSKTSWACRSSPGHSRAALMKKRKEEILHNKEQFTVQSKV